MERQMISMPKRRLELVHLQITKGCNLHCWFCGQWGNQGFFSQESGTALTLAEWHNVIRSIVRHRAESGTNTGVVLWGGEPLTSPYFGELAERLAQENIPVSMVTNGTLLGKWRDVCRRCVSHIYLSLDGPQPVHDKIRGEGVYQKVLENIRDLQKTRPGDVTPCPKLTLMSVLTDATRAAPAALLEDFIKFRPDDVLLQEMIGLNDAEITGYCRWIEACFGVRTDYIRGFRSDQIRDAQINAREMQKKLAGLSYPFAVRYLPHGAAAGRSFCLSPFRHAHVTWNGNVTYCTDFYDFSAGNVREHDLCDIFANERSERFRQEIAAGNCAACNHCSWKNSETFK